MHVNDTIRIDSLAAPEGVTLLDDPETVIATVNLPTRVEEPEAAEGEEGAAVEGEAEGGVPESADEAAGEAEASGEPGTAEG